MNNNIEPTRTSFFPNARKDKSINQNSKILKSRNTLERAAELKSNSKKDAKVNIPNVIKDFSRIKKAVDSSPEIDKSDKVKQLKAQIQSGDYKIDYDAVADRILTGF